jgi:hypothetical protein
MQAQATSQIMMIRPLRFGLNLQTVTSNSFQDINQSNIPAALTQAKALAEFDTMVQQLQAAGVAVMVVNDTPEPHTPDSIFPNNWVSFHADGTVVLYPMQAQNRRLERREDIIAQINERFLIQQILDLSYFEAENQFLEGTGSMVLDRKNQTAYACISNRTQASVLAKFGDLMGYKIVQFEATDTQAKTIYHTNVMMCIGEMFAVICLEAIPDLDQRLMVRTTLEKNGKRIVEIDLSQMNSFAGNMLHVKTNKGSNLLVMSTQAYRSLSAVQVKTLQEYCQILHCNLDVIEANGGGSARCMMAEVHLPLR